MTIYAGEELLLWTTAKGFAGEDLGSGDVDDARVTVWDSTLTIKVVDAAALTWIADELRWGYLWDTTDVDPGSYRAKYTITGLDNKDNFEWKRLRLARQPVV